MRSFRSYASARWSRPQQPQDTSWAALSRSTGLAWHGSARARWEPPHVQTPSIRRAATLRRRLEGVGSVAAELVSILTLAMVGVSPVVRGLQRRPHEADVPAASAHGRAQRQSCPGIRCRCRRGQRRVAVLEGARCCSMLLSMPAMPALHQHHSCVQDIPELTLCNLAEQRFDSSTRRGKHWLVCGGLHAPEGGQHRQHLGRRGRRCRPAAHGLGSCGGAARPGIRGPRQRSVPLAGTLLLSNHRDVLTETPYLDLSCALLFGTACPSQPREPMYGVLLQMPHFLALAWLCREDYARGGYRMLSLVDISGRRTAACALRNSLYLLPAGCLATYLGVTTVAFSTEAAIMTGADSQPNCCKASVHRLTRGCSTKQCTDYRECAQCTRCTRCTMQGAQQPFAQHSPTQHGG